MHAASAGRGSGDKFFQINTSIFTRAARVRTAMRAEYFIASVCVLSVKNLNFVERFEWHSRTLAELGFTEMSRLDRVGSACAICVPPAPRGPRPALAPGDVVSRAIEAPIKKAIVAPGSVATRGGRGAGGARTGKGERHFPHIIASGRRFICMRAADQRIHYCHYDPI
ncbi:hypothetical protein EVAR_33404_1 [Eumeta japonica]|uniref:Uncharacterized protein n=1 Tax=Eumeta variegata TaxID=151549 RepID=A0A4C1W4H4_EUMVA|nr:hypothetical protein EVAR_33404_1 [Eumeta japonica]